MAEVRQKAQVIFQATLIMGEEEIRAFDALVGYGDDAFLAVFKEKLGEAYIRSHEAGLRSAFSAIRVQLLPALHDIDQARRDLHAAAVKRADERAAAK